MVIVTAEVYITVSRKSATWGLYCLLITIQSEVPVLRDPSRAVPSARRPVDQTATNSQFVYPSWRRFCSDASVVVVMPWGVRGAPIGSEYVIGAVL